MSMKAVVRPSILVLAAGCALALLAMPTARSQIDVAPSYQPIGVAATGTTSTAWFHEPSSRRAVACQTVVTPGKGLSDIQCVAAKLP